MVFSDGVAETTMSESPASAGDLLELLGQTPADARRTEQRADVKVCELRDAGSQVRHDDPDANQLLAGERTECGAADVDVVLERVHVGLHGVLTVAVRVPGRRIPAAVPGDELCTELLVEHVDALPTVNRGDARQLGPAQPSELDCRSHRLTLTHPRSVGRPVAAAPARRTVEATDTARLSPMT